MKRRLLPILMTLVLVCALPIWAAFVIGDVKSAHMGSFCYIGDVTNPLVSTAWATLPDLQAKIDAAADNATITLDSNTEIAATLQITKNLTLDLNGCTLRMTGDGSVLKVSGRATLTITDSRPQNPHTGSYGRLPAGGVITGGEGMNMTGIYNVGGAVFLENGTTLKLEGGTITGNSSRGSVFIDGAIFEMSGGTITGETVGVRNNVGTLQNDRRPYYGML